MKKKKVIKYLICFFVPIIIFNICLGLNNIAPLGKNLITVYDSNLQYPGFFYGLKNFNLFSFGLGLGFNYLGTYTYYLVNPLNWLIKFFDITQFNTFYYILLCIKFGLCGITMQYFLSHENKNDNLFSCVFSIIYALSGFIATYYYNTFWIDAIILLPLVLKGINNIVRKKSVALYLFSLTTCIILCFYTGYMVGIFSIIYFLYKIIEEKKYKDKKVILHFLISTILAIILSAIVLVPSFFTLINGKSQGFSDPFTSYLKFNSNIKYLFYSFTPGNYQSSQVSYGFAQNFCTLFIIVLVILSFFNKNIKIRTKVITGIIIVYYLLSYSFNLLDFSWQFFQKPVWWQHRYSFTFSCLLIIIAYKNLMNFNKCKLHIIIKISIFVVLSLLINISFIMFFKNFNIQENYRIFIIIFSNLLIFNYLFLFNPEKKYKYIIIILIITELILNSFISIKQNNKSGSLYLDTLTKQEIAKNINTMKEYDNSFYRSELTHEFSSNDGLLFNYNGVNYFNSLRNQKVINLFEYYLNMIVDSHCSMKIKSFDPYLMSLLNIKYFIGNSKLYYYEEVAENVYQNPYSLSTSFLVNKNIINVKLKKNDFHTNIEKIYSSMINEDLNIYLELDNVDIKLDNSIYDESKKQYIRLDNNSPGSVALEYTAKENIFIIPQYNNVKNFGTLYINGNKEEINSSYIYLKKGDTIKIINTLVQNNEDISIAKLKYIKESDYNYVMNKLYANNEFNNVIVNNKHLYQTTVNVKDINNNYLFTTIPYEEGMTIKVNNKKVKPDLVLDAFIGIKLDEGKNEITIDYIPKGLISGTIISIIGLLLSLLYIKRWKN